MKAIRISRPGVVEMADIPKPTPRKGEALLRPVYGGICGSDLSSYRGTNAYLQYPRIPGHEFSAEVVEINGEDRGFKPGDLVTCNPYFNCGSCYSCDRGLVNACMHNETMGVQRDGAFAEYITMPVQRLIASGGLPAKTLALIEPFCIGRHGIHRADVRKGDTVLVMGAGTIGVLAALAAKAAGGKVYVSDISEKKLEYAMRFGFAGSLLNRGAESLVQETQTLTNGCGFDVTVEAVGLPSTLQACLDCVAFGGRVAVIGVGKHNIDLDFTVIQKKELNIFGSRNALTEDFEALIRDVREQKIDLDGVVTNIYDFSDAPRAFADYDKNAADMLKVMLAF